MSTMKKLELRSFLCIIFVIYLTKEENSDSVSIEEKTFL